ncbi:hypothetical protein RJT34_22853 [Clitoria ternatea]|uniref:Uncharacterized protein n=1 Tax=Clitoria ternatea TaxID=43366 RepID=A0AAN9FKN8_CLITE
MVVVLVRRFGFGCVEVIMVMNVVKVMGGGGKGSGFGDYGLLVMGVELVVMGGLEKGMLSVEGGSGLLVRLVVLMVVV